jgi:hypothetical protein
MKNKEEVTDQILEIELDMFLNVPTPQKSACQYYPDNFRLHRKAQFMAWSVSTLESYLDDLQQAKKEGINVMTIKYARMDDLIPQENQSPFIDKIAEILYRWQDDFIQRYPYIMGRGRPLSKERDTPQTTSFETYLKGELETYSEKTLTLLYADIEHMLEKGMSIPEETYKYLIKELGYSSLEHAESQAKKRYMIQALR